MWISRAIILSSPYTTDTTRAATAQTERTGIKLKRFCDSPRRLLLVAMFCNVRNNFNAKSPQNGMFFATLYRVVRVVVEKLLLVIGLKVGVPVIN